MKKALRLQVYKYMLLKAQEHVLEEQYFGFCWLWLLAANHLEVHNGTMEDLKELMSFEPLEEYKHGCFWYPYEDSQIRIQILEKIIAKMEEPWYQFWK